MPKYVERPANTEFQRRMALGHRNRLGHELEMVQISDDGIIWRNVRLCCGDTVPDTLEKKDPPLA